MKFLHRLLFIHFISLFVIPEAVAVRVIFEVSNGKEQISFQSRDTSYLTFECFDSTWDHGEEEGVQWAKIQKFVLKC